MAHIYPTMNACQYVLCAATGTDADEPDSCHGEERDYINMVIFGEEGELVRRKCGVEHFGESHWGVLGVESASGRGCKGSRGRALRVAVCVYLLPWIDLLFGFPPANRVSPSHRSCCSSRLASPFLSIIHPAPPRGTAASPLAMLREVKVGLDNQSSAPRTFFGTSLPPLFSPPLTSHRRIPPHMAPCRHRTRHIHLLPCPVPYAFPSPCPGPPI